MTQATIGPDTSTYVYNGDGLRVSRTVGGVATNYIWDTAAKLPVVLQDGENTYVYGYGLISTTDSAGNQAYRLTDGLGSTTDLVDGAGNVLVSYTYDAFGAVRTQSSPNDNAWLFAGEQRDTESGFDYLRARYYDSVTGRFMGRDSAEPDYNAPGTLNRFAYALSNPVNMTDPTGLWTICNQWDSTLSDPAAGQYTCAVTMEVEDVTAAQVVYDYSSNIWTQPLLVKDWKEGDWACASNACVSQVGDDWLALPDPNVLLWCDYVWQSGPNQVSSGFCRVFSLGSSNGFRDEGLARILGAAGAGFACGRQAAEAARPPLVVAAAAAGCGVAAYFIDGFQVP